MSLDRSLKSANSLVRHRNVAMIPNCAPNWTDLGWLHGAPLFTFAGMSFIFNPMKMGLRGLYMPKFDAGPPRTFWALLKPSPDGAQRGT